MTIYSCVILLTELMMLAMMIHVIHYSGFEKAEKGWYVATFAAIMLCAAAEFSAIHFNARGRGFVVPLTIITVIQFSLSPMLPVFLAGALGMRRTRIQRNGSLWRRESGRPDRHGGPRHACVWHHERCLGRKGHSGRRQRREAHRHPALGRQRGADRRGFHPRL